VVFVFAPLLHRATGPLAKCFGTFVRSFVRSFVRERFFLGGVSKNHQGGTCENLLKIVAINESLHLGSEKSPPYGRAQRLTRPKCAFLGKITRQIKNFLGRFQREERNEK
jgi:hypothetical protein